MNDKKFTIALEKQLELFRTATEWSDLVAYLTGLESILKIYKFSQIPRPALFYRRLNQCLNPSLPAGVHTKTLEVYKIVLSRMDRNILSQEIDKLCLGLFSFYSHAGLSTIPNYMEVIQQIIGILKKDVKRIARHIVVSLVIFLEEENGEQYSMALDTLCSLEKEIGKDYLIRCVWEIMGEGTELVPGCVAYLFRMKTSTWEGSNKNILMSKGFSLGLQSKEIVTLRKIFDILIAYKEEDLIVEEPKMTVTLSVLNLLLLKEISLWKRVQQWMEKILQEENGCTDLFEALCTLYQTKPEMYFKILIGLHQSIEGTESLLVLCIKWILSQETIPAEEIHQAFFKIINRRIVWGALSSEGIEASVIERAIQYGLLDTYAALNELPSMLPKYISDGSAKSSWFSLVTPNAQAYTEICNALIDRVSLCDTEEGLKLSNLFVHLLPEESSEVFYQYREAVICIITQVFSLFWKAQKENILENNGLPEYGYFGNSPYIVDTRSHSTRIFSTRTPPEKFHYAHDLIISSLDKISQRIDLFTIPGIDNHLESLFEYSCYLPHLFWDYDRPLNGWLQEKLISKILYQNNSLRHRLEESKELMVAFYLLENNQHKNTHIHNILFLINFCCSSDYTVSERAKLFIGRITCFKELIKEMFQRLNNPLERIAKEGSIKIVDCNYNRILSGLRLLLYLCKYSNSFLKYLRTEEEAIFLSSISNVSVISEYMFTEKTTTLASSLLSLLLIYATSEYTSSKTVTLRTQDILRNISQLEIKQSIQNKVVQETKSERETTTVESSIKVQLEQRNIIDNTSSRYISEIEDTVFKITDILLCKEIITLPISLKSTIISAMFSTGIGSKSIFGRLNIAYAFNISLFHMNILQCYKNNPEIREEIVQFSLEKNILPLILDLFNITCLLVSDGYLSDFRIIEHILYHCISPRDSKQRKEKEEDILCSCSLSVRPIQEEQDIQSIISSLFRLALKVSQIPLSPSERVKNDTKNDSEKETTLERAKDKVPLLKEVEKTKRQEILKTLQRYTTRMYHQNTQVFSGSIVQVYSEEQDITFIKSISQSIAGEVFVSVLRLTSVPSICKYALLKDWILFGMDISLFETDKTFNTLRMIISQTRTKIEDFSLLYFLQEFFRVSTTHKGVEIGTKIIEVVTGWATKIGIKKGIDLEENTEKKESILQLIRITRTVLEVFIRKNASIDILPIWNVLVLSCYKQPSASVFYKESLELTILISRVPENNKCWKKDFYDLILSERFFKDSKENIEKKLAIGSAMVEPEKIVDLISKASSSGFFIRESDIIGRAAIIKRLRFMILCAPFGTYTQEMSGILGLLSDIFTNSLGVKALVTEAYSLCRALCIKLPVVSLINLWPLAISEAITAITPGHKISPAIVFGALRFLDLVSTLNYPDTLEFRWLVENLSNPSKDSPQSTIQLSNALRVPCIDNVSSWAHETIPAVLSKVSAHHRSQRYASQPDWTSMLHSLTDDLSEENK
ncbi:hypothetical protein NEOKW01_0343 [Nematocida sp. AWRm80]|nr:hypothetical protein NEOKW01_0343 [Nematocida sp. AWRm80]